MGEKFKENMLEQWHKTRRIEENGVVSFLKEYEPNSYEIKNEISWLTSTMIRSCKTFNVPEVRGGSIEEGWVKMGYLDITSQQSEKEVTDWLIKSALELHAVIKTDQPHLKKRTSASEYQNYTRERTMQKVRVVEGTEFEVVQEIVDWILKRIATLNSKYFTIAHRDLRARHLLFTSETKKPTLIDWEFSDISDPAGDLAKIIYDGVVDRKLNKEEMTKHVIDAYSQETSNSAAEIEERVRIFMPIIPLEHVMSFITRKPEGYAEKVMADLCYINALYEEDK